MEGRKEGRRKKERERNLIFNQLPRWFICTLRFKNHCYRSQAQRLSPIILATWEAEFGRIMVWGQSGPKIHKMPSQPMVGWGGTLLSSLVTWRSTNRRFVVQASPGIKWDLISKNRQHYNSWWSGSSVEHCLAGRRPRIKPPRPSLPILCHTPHPTYR
jgi:hypothetical protein